MQASSGPRATDPSAAVAVYVPARPHPSLAALVTGYLGYRERSTAPLRRRQAPTAGCPLILGFGGPLRLHGPAGTSDPNAFLAGMHDAAVITEFTGEQCGVQVDLTPLGVFALLGRPMNELANLAVSLDQLEAPDLAALPGQLAEDTGWSARFARVDSVLRRRLGLSAVRPDPEVRWAWERLVSTGGVVGVAELAAGTGWSRRHLLTRFGQQVGLGPKTAARVLRLQRATGLLVPPASGESAPAAGLRSLADVAAVCGFADHSHLAREFRALAGCTPTQYVQGWRTA